MEEGLDTTTRVADPGGRRPPATVPRSREALWRLQAVLGVARAAFGQDATLPTLRVFLDIALHGETHMTAIAERLAMGKSSASRNVSMLTEVTWLRKAGPGLVSTEEDFRERRIRRLSLTPRGRAVAEQLAIAFAAEGEPQAVL